MPDPGAPAEGWWRVSRAWAVGDLVVLELPLEPRLTTADPRVDADRGCVALERGPLVYCLEAVDHPGRRLDDLLVDPAAPLWSEDGGDALGPLVVVGAAGAVRARTGPSGWPYGPVAEVVVEDVVPLRAVPYFAWGNRGPGAMRVWVPITT